MKTTEKRPDRIYKYVDSQNISPRKRKREQGDDNGDLIGVHYPDGTGWRGMKVRGDCWQGDVGDCAVRTAIEIPITMVNTAPYRWEQWQGRRPELLA
ncbi:hypothetical protein ACP0HM_08085 [Escherichia coli]